MADGMSAKDLEKHVSSEVERVGYGKNSEPHESTAGMGKCRCGWYLMPEFSGSCMRCLKSVDEPNA